jgi:hypothetical protein
MKGANWKVWIYRAGLALGALIFLVQMITGIRSIQSSQLTDSFSVIALMSIIGMVLVVGLQIVNYKILLRSIGINLALVALFKGFVISSLPKYIPGSIWIFFSRGQWLKKAHGIAHELTNLVNLFEIEVTLISASGVVLLGMAIYKESWSYLAVGLLLPSAILATTPYLIRFILHKGWFGLHNPANHPSVYPQFLWLASLVSGVEWLIFGSVTLLLMTGNLPQGALTLRQWILAVQSFTLAWLGGFLVIFVPGGLGIRELALTGLLISNFSINHQTSALLAIASRLFYSAGEIIWLAMGLVLRAVKKGE